MTTNQVTQKANDYFNVAFTRPDTLNKQLTVTPTRADREPVSTYALVRKQPGAATINS